MQHLGRTDLGMKVEWMISLFKSGEGCHHAETYNGVSEVLDIDLSDAIFSYFKHFMYSSVHKIASNTPHILCYDPFLGTNS